jgi:outer membrane murein-binding lipoprotein Lpp
MRHIKFLPKDYFAMSSRMSRDAIMAALATVTLFSTGCVEKQPRAYPWATAIHVRPRMPIPAPGYTPSPLADESAPDLPWDFSAPPAIPVGTRQPARPRTASTQPAPEAAGPVKTDAPLLAPQLSEPEIAAAQQQMNDSIATSQRNLSAAKSRRLNAAQTDLASKVNSFMEDSKAAAKDGDWTRAKNLAKKAQVLSEELAGSL